MNPTPFNDLHRFKKKFPHGAAMLIYGIVLLLAYGSLWLIKPFVDIAFIIYSIMFAPLIAAFCAAHFASVPIQWGPINRWTLVALLAVVAPLLALLMMVPSGMVTLSSSNLAKALLSAPITISMSCITAFGEEVGWRGFLWPLMRKHMSFLRAASWLGIVWLLYHIPLILSGDYGSISGLPAFIIAIMGFTLFVGVLTDRSRAVWPAVLAHGAWNALVAPNFSEGVGITSASFVGDNALLGEFGFIPAVAMLILGVMLSIWHVTTTMRR